MTMLPTPDHYLKPTIAVAAPRKKPGELGLDMSAAVMRLRYPPGTRMVLAEIISLHLSSRRGCDASDQHFADRIGVGMSKNSATAAVGALYKDGLIAKDVNKGAGNYRVLVPLFDAIEAAAKLNPYPEKQGRTTPKFGVGSDDEATPEIGVGYPENQGSSTPEIGAALPQNLGTNTSVNPSPNLSSTPQPAQGLPAAVPCASESEKKEGPSPSSDSSTASASHTGGASRVPTRKAASKKAQPIRPALVPLPESCPLAELLNEGGDAAKVQQLEEPLTAAQAEKLLAEFSEPLLRDIFCQMANWKLLLTKATSANLTARNWLRKRATEAPKPAQHDQPHNTQAGRSNSGRNFPRSINGAKPSADAGAFARALAERRGQQPGS